MEPHAEQKEDLSPHSVEALCEQLKHGDLKVRTSAAATLAEIGDERAIGPLSEAIRDLYVGRSAWHHKAWQSLKFAGCLVLGAPFGCGAVLLVVLVLETWYWALPILGAGLIFLGVATVVALASPRLTEEQSEQRLYAEALVMALEEITRRSPSLEARSIILELRSLADSKLGTIVEPETVQRARWTADQIERLTLERHRLPLPGPEASVNALPRTADPPSDAGSNLPRPEGKPEAP